MDSPQGMVGMLSPYKWAPGACTEHPALLANPMLVRQMSFTKLQGSTLNVPRPQGYRVCCHGSWSDAALPEGSEFISGASGFCGEMGK